MPTASLSVFPQYLLPKHALTLLAGRIANADAGSLTTLLIRWFVWRYGVNMDEAVNPDIRSYRTFNEFFTRPLHLESRPISDADYACPADGLISQLGVISGDQIFQAKGHNYSAAALLGGDTRLAEKFHGGNFATLYLSPRDYHRVHMPVDARVTRMIYVPGDLFSVNAKTVRGVPGLFARNERVVCVFESEFGPFALVLVGATIVGSVATVWHGVVNPRDSEGTRDVREWRYDSPDRLLRKGAEMGRFQLGSTVVMLFPKNKILFNSTWAPGRTIRFGEMMATKADPDK